MFLSNFRLKTVIQSGLVNLREILDYPLQHPSRGLQQQALAESVEFLNALDELPLAFPSARELLAFAIDNVSVDGPVVELGVYKGATIRFIAKRLPERQVDGFDTFSGLPSGWSGNASRFDAKGVVPRVPSNVRLHVGMFADTLPRWLEDNPQSLSFVHVDCDLYESTSSAFAVLGEHMTDGTIIVFDEFFNYPGWQKHEFRAFEELVAKHDFDYTFLGYSRIQMAVRIGTS
jgi:predicted O-methyltransferase YrrM